MVAVAKSVRGDPREVSAKAFAGSVARRPLGAWSPSRGSWGHAQKAALLEMALASGASAYVVGAHTSKGQELPVVLFVFGGGTAYLVFRFNHYTAVATFLLGEGMDVAAAVPRSADMILESTSFSKAYAEGFPEPLICGTYEESRRAFTSYVTQGKDELAELLAAVAQDAGSAVRRKPAAA